jgi:hypothetical protein
MSEPEYSGQETPMTTDLQSPSPSVARSVSEDHIELLLDHALAATFPAGDPVAVTVRPDFLPRAAKAAGRVTTGTRPADPGELAARPHPRCVTG